MCSARSSRASRARPSDGRARRRARYRRPERARASAARRRDRLRRRLPRRSRHHRRQGAEEGARRERYAAVTAFADDCGASSTRAGRGPAGLAPLSRAPSSRAPPASSSAPRRRLALLVGPASPSARPRVGDRARSRARGSCDAPRPPTTSAASSCRQATAVGRADVERRAAGRGRGAHRSRGLPRSALRVHLLLALADRHQREPAVR